MPVLTVSCPDCGNVARTFVFEGCRMPDEWVCGACGGRRAHPDPQHIERHPWENAHGLACLCCGPGSEAPRRCSAVDG